MPTGRGWMGCSIKYIYIYMGGAGVNHVNRDWLEIFKQSQKLQLFLCEVLEPQMVVIYTPPLVCSPSGPSS